MAVDSFIPTLWSAQILQNLHKSMVFGQPGVINRNYEGEIRNQGDTVKINAIGAVTVGTYTKNTDMNAAQTLDSTNTVLTIDKSEYFNFQVDDVDKVQTQPKVMAEAMREAGYALSDAMDTYIGTLWSQVAAANYIGTNGSPKTDLGTVGYAYNYLVDLSVSLSNNNVPQEGRWCVVPPWFEGVMVKDTTHFTLATAQGEDRIQNAVIGRAAGFTILRSNNVAKTSATSSFKIIAGHSMAWTLAEQISQVEAYRPQLRFADAVKGLHLYGAKVSRPSAMAVLFASVP
jgi:hypothetical protein